MKRNKKANHNQSKRIGKYDPIPTIFQSSSDSDNPIWSFSKIERDGKFAFDVNREDFEHKDFLEKMIEYSNMTWGEIKKQTHDKGKSKHHMLSFDQISKEAQKFFSKKHLEDYTDSIFSFAFNNRTRIIGIRENQFFHVVWYDRYHEFCPSKLKHT